MGSGDSTSDASPGAASSGGASTGSSGASGGGPAPLSVPVGAGLRGLSKREYNNVVRDLLGDTSLPANQFGAETLYPNGYDNGSDGLVVARTSEVTDLQGAAEALAARAVANNLPALIGNCDPTQNAAACVEAFLSTFPAKAYRRTPTATELSRLRTVYASTPTSGSISGFKGGLQLMLEAILQSPAFLYREELGQPDPTLPKGVVRLADSEVASELSFLLTGTIPDADLLNAAQNGNVRAPADLVAQAKRLLQLPAAKPAMRAFLNQWMATDERLTSQAKDPVVYPTFNQGLVDSMGAELGQYFDQVLWSGTGSIRELFTSTQGFVDANLAALYGVPAPTGTGPQLTLLDPIVRQGIFTRAGWLTAHSDSDNSGPVARGVFLMVNVLCMPPPPPPTGLSPPLPPAAVAAAKMQTTRQALEQALAGQPACAGCHGVIDGVGYGFEEFDAIGRYRTTENTQNVDDSGQVAESLDPDIANGPSGFVFDGRGPGGSLNGAAQLATRLLGSPQVQKCFVTQAYRYAMGQVETPSATATLGDMQKGFNEDSPVINAFLALVAEPAFVLRTTLRAGP
jgi:hypothetical protein